MVDDVVALCEYLCRVNFVSGINQSGTSSLERHNPRHDSGGWVHERVFLLRPPRTCDVFFNLHFYLIPHSLPLLFLSFGICSSCCSNAFSIILNARRASSLRAPDRGGFGHNARNTRDSEPQLYDLWSPMNGVWLISPSWPAQSPGVPERCKIRKRERAECLREAGFESAIPDPRLRPP